MASDQEIKDLAEELQAIREMQLTAGWGFMERRLQATFERHQRLILNGHLTHEDYLRESGKVAGIRHAIELEEMLDSKLDRMIAENAAEHPVAETV